MAAKIIVLIDMTRFQQVRKERREAFLTKWNAAHAKDITGKIWPKFYLVRTGSAGTLLEMMMELQHMTGSNWWTHGWTITPVEMDTHNRFALRNKAQYILEPRRLEDDPYYD